MQRTGSFLYQPQMTAITAYRWNDRQIVLTGDEKGNVYVWDPYAPEKQAGVRHQAMHIHRPDRNTAPQ